MEEKNWYVLFVMGGKEQQLCEFLNEEDSWNTFYPRIELIRRQNGVDHIVVKPLFPSYIFIESDINQQAFRDKIQALRTRKTGIIKELKYQDDIPALHKEEKSYLQGLLDDSYTLKKSEGFIENDHVVITNGPLKGSESYISRINRHKRKAVLELTMLHKKIDVTVPLEIIKKI